MTESTQHSHVDPILQRLKTITDAAQTSIVFIDAEERYTFVNRYYVERYGRTDSVGKTIREVIGNEAYEKIKANVHLALSGKSISFETEIERPDRSNIFVNATYSPSFNSNGEVEGFVSVSEDITERKERENKNAFLLKSLSAFSKALTPTQLLLTTIELCSEAFGSDSGMLAVPNESDTHLCFVPHIPGAPKVSPGYEASGIPIDSNFAAAQIYRSGKPAFISSRAERDEIYPEAKGSDPERYVEAFASLPLHFEGRKIGLLGIVYKKKRELSDADKKAFIAMGDLVSLALERSQLYERTQIERDRFRAFFDLSGSGAAEIDNSNDRFIRVNHRFSEITGYTEDELQKMTLLDLTWPDDLDETATAYQKLKDGPDSSWRVEKRYKRKDGSTCWVICSGTILRDLSGLALRSLVTFFDITNLKDAEKALIRAVKSRDDFLSIASHELKTPLTSLQLQIQLRQRDLKRNVLESFTPEKLDSWLNDQNKYVNRISHLVDDILDVSRLAEGKLHFQYEDFDLCEMITEVLKRFKVTADTYGVELKFDSCDPVHGKWDRFRLEQVLLNLLSNALRYGNKKPVRVNVSSDETHAILSVKDEGIGISSKDKIRIFHRFERAISENEVSGLGLGLFISNEIVTAHRGSIEVISELDKGSEFIVTIPRVPAAKENGNA